MRLTKVTDWLEETVEETWVYYAFPNEHWHRIRTDNPLERIMREIWRRTRVVGAFPDGQAALNLAAARLRHIAGTKWSSKRYMNRDLLKQRDRGAWWNSPPNPMCERSWTLPPANADGGIDWLSGVGASGYILKEFDPEVCATLARNPNYWKTDRAHFDQIELLSIVAAAARSNALITGEIDVMDHCNLKTVHLLKRTPGLHVEEVTGTLHCTFPRRTDIAPFDNNDVRLAFKYAVDREELVRKILRGHGIAGNDHPIGPANRFFAKGLEQRSYDSEARQLPSEEGLTADLSTAEAAFGGAVDAVVLYKEQAAKAGITINVVREPNDGYWSNVWLKKPWCDCCWSGRPTENLMFSMAYEAGADWNNIYWNNERFNQLLVQAHGELDQDIRRDQYAEMQTLVRNQDGVTIPMLANYVFAVSERVQHEATMAGNWDLDDERFMERWCFA